jgi:hypothetical protein
MSVLDYLLIGHVTADIKGDVRVLGGTVSYAALVARAFDLQVGVLTSARADEPLLRALSDEINVVNWCAPHTTTFENVYRGQTREQTLHARANVLTYAHVPHGWQDVPLVHLAPVADEIDPQLLTRFPHAVVMLTPQGLLRQWDAHGRVTFKRWFNPEVLQSVTVMVLSKQDIAPEPSMEALFANVVPHVIVTDGASGGVYYHRGHPYPYDAFPVTEVDPTGAGDVFATALLASLPRVGYDWQRALGVAKRLSALSVTHHGTNKPTFEDVAWAFHEA